ncbi:MULTISPECIES: hypothetical protein [Dehalobacter]|uniref:hypothetical protein n=1 Tax=Dehalobacter TaxID=56112 RepID=UPI0025859D7F|nr:hypothetical protein [Dehalobacter sp.]MDJ0305896.1 hypothetical protein [Dehalobacter sp.]
MDEKNKTILASAKKDMEVSEEIGDLRSQLSAMENTMNQLKQVSFSNFSSQGSTVNQNEIIQQSQQAANQLQQQIQGFRNQTQQQKQQADQQLRQAIQTAMTALTQANQQIQAHQVLEQMGQLIDQTQGQLFQMSQQGQSQQPSQYGQSIQGQGMQGQSRPSH